MGGSGCALRHKVALLTLLALAGCVVPLERPEIATPAGGGPVEAALLIGDWQCRDLNPLPGQPPQTVATRYADDGSFRSLSELPVHGPIGPIEIVQQGRWALDGDRLTTSDVTTAARALDGNGETDAYARAGAELVDAMGAGRPVASRVLLLDSARLTLRPVDVSDPPVVGCTRS
jgi:hypothetical protein